MKRNIGAPDKDLGNVKESERFSRKSDSSPLAAGSIHAVEVKLSIRYKLGGLPANTFRSDDMTDEITLVKPVGCLLSPGRPQCQSMQ